GRAERHGAWTGRSHRRSALDLARTLWRKSRNPAGICQNRLVRPGDARSWRSRWRIVRRAGPCRRTDFITGSARDLGALWTLKSMPKRAGGVMRFARIELAVAMLGVVAASEPAVAQDGLAKIKTIVVIYGENRSFDHM